PGDRQGEHDRGQHRPPAGHAGPAGVRGQRGERGPGRRPLRAEVREGHVLSRLWDLVQGAQAIDPEDLAAALEEEMQQNPAPDYRTRVLMEECASVLGSRWGWRAPRPLEPTGEERRRFPSL